MTVHICTGDDVDAWDPPADESPAEHVMPRGLPRPIASCGLPQPYIAEWDELKKVHYGRRDLCVERRRCQVCGLDLGERAVVCARPGDEYVTDGAAIHPGDCWLLATTSCPELIQLQRAGQLLVWDVETSTLVADRPSGGIGAALLVLQAGGSAAFYRTPDTAPDPA